MENKIYEILKERIEKTEKGKYCKLSYNEFLEVSGLNKDEFKVAMSEAFKDKENPIFFYQDKEERVAFDGELEASSKTTYFIDKENFLEFNENLREYNERIQNDFYDKKNRAYNLSPEAYKIFNVINDLTYKAEPKKGYVDLKEVRKVVDLKFDTFNDELKKLKDEKILYTAKVSKIEKIDNKDYLDEKYVVMHSGKVLNKTIEREDFKEKLWKEEGKDIEKLPKLKDLNKEKEVKEPKKSKWSSKETQDLER